VDQEMAKLVTRTLLLDGEETKLSLEMAFWDALMLMADDQRKSVGAIIEEANDTARGRGLSSTVRLFVLDYYRKSQAMLDRPSRRVQGRRAPQ
jgi:predicted DNA-binding ribbon-helix-helix protein